MRRAIRGRQAWGMHSEWIDGIVLRPMMDAGYTAWRGEERLGIAWLHEDRIEIEAHDPRVRALLAERLEGDARAAGIPLFAYDVRLQQAA
jgi:hypothetical protein